MRPLLALLSLTACVPARTSDPSTDRHADRIVNPCDRIRLPSRLDAAARVRLAGEIAAAPADAIWPDVLRDAAGIERALRACRTPDPLTER